MIFYILQFETMSVYGLYSDAETQGPELVKKSLEYKARLTAVWSPLHFWFWKQSEQNNVLSLLCVTCALMESDMSNKRLKRQHLYSQIKTHEWIFPDVGRYEVGSFVTPKLQYIIQVDVKCMVLYDRND